MLKTLNSYDQRFFRKVRRFRSHEVTVVPNPCVCVTGCLPPEVISDLWDPSQRADGLLDRMLFAFPEVVPLQWTDAGVTAAMMAGYAEVLAALWQFEAASRPEVGHGARPVVMTLTAEGRAAFVRLVNDLYAQLADPELPDHLREPCAKLEGYAARLALILHLCRLVSGETEAEVVEEQSVTAAIALVHYFQAHAKRVYARLRSTRADQRAETAIR